jgi:BirA family biotin operon repressor/biotin-[acetyl-CoA-carboxylase] ligase
VNWGGEAIWQEVAPLLAGFTVEVLPEVDSTNTELMRRARAGRTEPVLLAAERQTQGRGRLGRNWASAPGDSLTFSLGLPLAPADWAGMSLAVGVAVAEQLHPRVRIKWPNDLWVDDRKLAGILIETASTAAPSAPRYAVIGVGINVKAPHVEGLSTPPACIAELLPELDAPGVLARVAKPLVETVLAFETFGFAPFQARFDARDALRDRPVVLSDGTTGTAHGTTQTGGLLVHTAAGMTTVTSSEVSVRPAA